MLKLQITNQFKRDLKLMKRRGMDLKLLESVIDTLLQEKKLDERYRDHLLNGNYDGFRECHIKPDWLFIYCIESDKLILVASRTGTHSDLF